MAYRLGISQSQLSAYERCRVVPPVAMLIALAREYDVPPCELLPGG